MARHRSEPPADLVPAELLTFDQQEWQREGDNGRWQPAFHRWSDAREAWCEVHPESTALGNRLERFRFEFHTQYGG